MTLKRRMGNSIEKEGSQNIRKERSGKAPWRLPPGLEGEGGKALEQLLQPLAPGLSQRHEMGVLFGDAVLVRRREAALVIDQGIQGQAHRQIAAQGRVDGDEGALQCGLKRRLMVDDAIDDGFAVLALTNLEVGGVGARLDEVALRIDVEQAVALPGSAPSRMLQPKLIWPCC